MLADSRPTASSSGRNGSRPSSSSASVLRGSRIRGQQAGGRQALEPWHVTGEQGRDRWHGALCRQFRRAASGEVRDGEPRALSGNLQRAAGAAEGDRSARTSVAGVRFKAWHPASGIHPVLPVNAPLTFDIYDTWSSRSLGGCVYHVAHPGGRSYDTFPVNGNEAEARRLALPAIGAYRRLVAFQGRSAASGIPDDAGSQAALKRAYRG